MTLGAMRTSRAPMAGFTAIELMVTVAIIAILLALAIPSFNDATLSSQLAANANRVSGSATMARSEAIKRNANVIVCMSSNGTSCATSGGWEQGWIILSGSTVLLQEQAANLGLKLNVVPTTATSLTFDATGVGTTQADFTICRATPTVGSQQRVVSISATGRISVTKATTTSCA